MAEVEDLNSLKSTLREMLSSGQRRMKVSSLTRDYYHLTGRDLPWVEYGYRYANRFLRDHFSDCFQFHGFWKDPILTPIDPVPCFVEKSAKPAIPHGRARTAANRGYTERKPPTERRRQEPALPPLVTDPAMFHLTRRPRGEQAESRRATADAPSAKVEKVSNEQSEHEEGNSHQRRQRFFEKQLPVAQSQTLGRKDSGPQTSSSARERAVQLQMAWARMKAHIYRLVERRPEGVWVRNLLRMYEEEYGRELNFARFGFPSISACACAVIGLSAQRAPDGNWLVTVQGREGQSMLSKPAPRQREVPRDSPAPLSASEYAIRKLAEAEDALPGIPYDPEVFPSDCLNFPEKIPSVSLADVAAGGELRVVVAEAYSPTDLWLQRLGPEYELMQDYMKQMTEYYSKGEGSNRVLAFGARLPGQYCSCAFQGKWHRVLIEQIVDSDDTVKVRYVDYGTVETVPARSLRPLLRSWCTLPAQAVRAGLGGVRPIAKGRRWLQPASEYFVDLVLERRFIAKVVAIDHQERILEVLLADTSTQEDVTISEQMVQAGYADVQTHSALKYRDGYLLPTFASLESTSSDECDDSSDA